MSILAGFFIFLFRLSNAFSIKTFFQPDEYFQALEPAHQFVFGYGYITWEWREALRSSIHPLLYAAAYKLATVMFPESWATFIAPKVVGAIISTFSDVCVFMFAQKFFQIPAVANISLCLSLFSSWNWYVSTRSFSNNLEMALTAAGLSFWPWHTYELKSLLISCTFGFLSCIVRPTNAILWGYLALLVLVKNRNRISRIVRLLISLFAVLSIVFILSVFADRLFYDRWTFPTYNFLEFNVIRNLSVFYGTAPWHFYLLQGLPIMLMCYTPALILAVFENSTSPLVGLILTYVTAFSLIAHKEFRFLQPIYPVLLVLCARTMYDRRNLKYAKVFVAVVVLIHSLTAYFFTRINEVGEIQVVELLRDDPTVSSIGFLMPCHSTPWHSVLHRAELVEDSWFLTCEPPLHLKKGTIENVKAYRDQSDIFFDDPVAFLRELPYAWPSHIVIFQGMEQIVKGELKNYSECSRIFNSYFHWDDRRKGDIIVLCQNSSLQNA